MQKKYEKRWLAAKKFIETKINPLLSNPVYFAAFDGDLISIKDPFVIDEENKEIVADLGNGCLMCIYNGDPDWDEGAHTPTREFIKDIRDRLQIFKEVKW